MATTFEPVWYHLDDGEKTPAVLVNGETLIVNLTTPVGCKYVGKQDWFAADYVAYWNGTPPDYTGEGTEPGQWSRPAKN